jgi:hypothetical protein
LRAREISFVKKTNRNAKKNKTLRDEKTSNARMGA